MLTGAALVQNVASYLALDLGLDWRMGADHFESLLLDYDVCSNWGNWYIRAPLAATAFVTEARCRAAAT